MPTMMQMDMDVGRFDGSARLQLAPGAWLLRGLALLKASALMRDVNAVAATAPFRHMKIPGGKAMSAAMTNCGEFGWIADPKGYRYAANDPSSGRVWPAMPAGFHKLAITAATVAGYPDFVPDSCLINCYALTANMGLHQDKDEKDITAPIVSVSLGLPAIFMFGGLRRNDPVQRFSLQHGDVVVWGGPLRLCYHGIAKVQVPDLLSDMYQRINLTFRKSQ